MSSSDEIQTLDHNYLLLSPRCTMCICGPSNCGKTTFVHNMLMNKKELFKEDPPNKVLYCYSIYQSVIDELKKIKGEITLYNGLPDKGTLAKFCDGHHNIVILDDLGHKLMENKDVEMLFTQFAHHMNLSIIFILHNLFQQGKCSRTIALNTKYVVLFESPRDITPLKILGRQGFPGRTNQLLEAYYDCISTRYGYLLIDFTPHIEEKFRLRTHIFPDEIMTVYM